MFRTEAHRHVERIQKVVNTAMSAWEHELASDATRHFRQRATSPSEEHLQSPRSRVRAMPHDKQDIFPKRRSKV